MGNANGDAQFLHESCCSHLVNLCCLVLVLSRLVEVYHAGLKLIHLIPFYRGTRIGISILQNATNFA